MGWEAVRGTQPNHGQGEVMGAIWSQGQRDRETDPENKNEIESDSLIVPFSFISWRNWEVGISGNRKGTESLNFQSGFLGSQKAKEL